MKSDISVLIPTYTNTTGLFMLLSYLKKTPYQIIVIDNGPDDEKKQFVDSLIRKLNNRFQYFPQQKNIGFAAAVNRGAEKVKTEWMAILNDDIEITSPHMLDQLIIYAETNKLTAVSPVLKNKSGEVENYGYIVLPYGKVKLIKQFSNVTIDGLTAACLLIKTDVFNKIGGFDESFFAYLEDVDFFLRLKKYFHNQTFSVNPDISVIHHHLTTSQTMGSFKARQDFVNWLRLINKHRDVFPIGNPSNLIKLLIERLRNISGLIKAL